MLPQASFNYEHFDFSTSFPRKFTTMPASIRSELFKPSHKCAFLVSLNVSRLNVRFFKVISFPSRKQVARFDVCPEAQLRKRCWAAALHGLDRAGVSSEGSGCVPRGVQRGGQLSPRGALSLERQRCLSFPPLQGCLIL